MTTVEYAHDMGDSVLIRAIRVMGQVDGMMSDTRGPMYRVVYWDDGRRNVDWMYDWEIAADGRG